jgi:hypothetical protein
MKSIRYKNAKYGNVDRMATNSKKWNRGVRWNQSAHRTQTRKTPVPNTTDSCGSMNNKNLSASEA